MTDNSRAYNSVWQLRSDAWYRLEEASDRLTRSTTSGELKEETNRSMIVCSLNSITPEV
jgi:arginine decarboxylase